MEREGMQTLAGRRVLVAGGTTGIGRACVELLLNANAKVATFARTEEDLKDLKALHPEVCVLKADLAKPEELSKVVDRVHAEFGGIDALINNAGIGAESVTTMSYKDWHNVIETNLAGPMFLTQLVSEKMTSGGHIINIGSLSAKTRGEGSDVYVATKMGLRGFSDSVGRLLGQKGIIVTLIEPGLVASDMTTVDKEQEEIDEQRRKDEMIEAADIARAVTFTLSQPDRMVIAEMQIRPRAQLI
ncbi:SDR family oxidoreductase [bacterium]|nr:MAG: SDR family oxidoreductase [bacterium]